MNQRDGRPRNVSKLKRQQGMNESEPYEALLKFLAGLESAS
jgi:hypothetical protein